MNAPKGFLLAAGMGTRLRPLSERVAKPAMPFFGVPMAAHALASLHRAGVREFIINLHHLPDTVKEALTPFILPDSSVRWSEEREKILGTGGAVMPWLASLEEGFFLANGDTYRCFGAGEMLSFHRKSAAAATLSAALLPEGEEGPLEISEEGRIERFLDAKRPGYRPGRAALFTGMHLFSPLAVSRFRKVGEAEFCVNRAVNKVMVAEGLPLYAYIPPENSPWSDLGTPESYLAAHFALLKEGVLPEISKGRFFPTDETTAQGGTVIAPSWLGEGAVVEAGATAGPCAVLGARARVLGGVKVERSVVWEGVEVTKDASGEILAGFESVSAVGGAR